MDRAGAVVIVTYAYPDGLWVANDRLAIRDRGIARLLNLATGKDQGRKVRAAALHAASPDGRWLLLATAHDTLLWSTL